MPFYHATIRPGLLPAAARQSFANDVVEVHCGVTGAPPSFVHVLITEDNDGLLASGSNAVVAGTIRAGRTDEQKREIVDRLSASMAARAGVAVASVTTTTRDVEASYTMEGGEVLPEPGSPDEERWKALGAEVQS